MEYLFQATEGVPTLSEAACRSLVLSLEEYCVQCLFVFRREILFHDYPLDVMPNSFRECRSDDSEPRYFCWYVWSQELKDSLYPYSSEKATSAREKFLSSVDEMSFCREDNSVFLHVNLKTGTLRLTPREGECVRQIVREPGWIENTAVE